MRVIASLRCRNQTFSQTVLLILCGTIAMSVGCVTKSQVSLRSNGLDDVHRIAILDFTDAPGADAGHSGRVVAGILGRRALAVKDWSLVERECLSNVLDEQDLQSTNIVDPQTAVQIGKIAGADGIVVGEVAQYRIGSVPFFFLFTLDQDLYKVDFSFRLLNVQTGEVCLSAHVSRESCVSFERAIAEGVDNVFAEIERQCGCITGSS